MQRYRPNLKFQRHNSELGSPEPSSLPLFLSLETHAPPLAQEILHLLTDSSLRTFALAVLPVSNALPPAHLITNHSPCGPFSAVLLRLHCAYESSEDLVKMQIQIQ